MKPLTIKMNLFCVNYVESAGGDGTKAYRMAYDARGMSDATVGSAAYKLLQNPRIQAKIKELQDKISERCELKVADIVNMWSKIVTADPNEIVQNRQECCRYCHGIDHQYQYTTKNEFDLMRARSLDAGKPMPDNPGGFGFNANADPHPECPECNGRGIDRLWIADTRRLKGSAKLLYAGIEKTSGGGIKIKFRDQDAAMANLAKFHGMLKNRVEVSAPGGAPLIPPDLSGMSQVEAGQAYQKFITGK